VRFGPLLVLILLCQLAYGATNPDISVAVDLGGSDSVLVGKSGTVTATLQWPPGDYSKPAGNYAWTVTDGIKITAGQGTASITIQGVISELAKATVQWTASGFDSPTGNKDIKVIGIGLLAWGRISSFTGDMYDDSGNTWIPPSGKAVLAATASDLDKVAGDYLNDTFDAYSAFNWSAAHGTATRAEQTTCNYVAPGEAIEDTITLKIKDDGKYFPDFSAPTYSDSRLVYIYELTGLAVSGATTEQRFTGANFVTVTLLEKSPGVRPQIKYEAIDQDGAVAFSSVSTSNSQLVKIPKPGKYTFQVTNVPHSSETFKKADYTFYTLTFSDTSKKFVWEKDKLLEGIEKVKDKGEAVDKALETFVKLTTLAGDGHDFASDYEEVIAKSTAAAAKATEDIATISSEIEGIKAAQTALNNKILLSQEIIKSINLLIQTETDPAKLPGLINDLSKATFIYNEEVGQAQSLTQSLLTATKNLDFSTAVKTVSTTLKDTAISLRTSTGSLSGAGTALKGILAAGVLPGVIDVIGVAGNVSSLIESGSKYDALIESWTNAEAIQQEYNDLLNALRAGRKDPILKDNFTVKSDPPGIKFKFTGAASWRTYDPGYADSSWSHLVSLDGDVAKWDAEQTTDSSGSVTFEIGAQGNLGYESIGLDKDISTMRIETGNWSEQEAIDQVKPVIDAEKAPNATRLQIFNDMLSYFDILLTAVGLFVVWTGLGAVVIGLIKLGVSLVDIGLDFCEDWIVSSDLEKLLRKLFP